MTDATIPDMKLILVLVENFPITLFFMAFLKLKQVSYSFHSHMTNCLFFRISYIYHLSNLELEINAFIGYGMWFHQNLSMLTDILPIHLKIQRIENFVFEEITK